MGSVENSSLMAFKNSDTFVDKSLVTRFCICATVFTIFCSENVNKFKDLSFEVKSFMSEVIKIWLDKLKVLVTQPIIFGSSTKVHSRFETYL